eukprot:795912-Pelagomonas_calceolata.AAC.1
MGIREVTSCSPRLVLMMKVGRSLNKSASGASKFISVLDRMSMKLQSKLGGYMNVKTKLFQRLQSVRGVDPRPHLTKWYGGRLELRSLKDRYEGNSALLWGPQADS